MHRLQTGICLDCSSSAPAEPSRRQFLRTVGGASLAVAAGGIAPAVVRAAPETKSVRPAEELVRELFSTLSAEQKQKLVMPWDHGADGGRAIPTRLRMFNAAIDGKRIGTEYSAAQQELNERILRAICSDDEGYRRITRDGKFDTGGGFKGCGAMIFGDPSNNQKFSWVFACHHLTVRCDGNSEPGAAFGGPMYYGHSAHGYSASNVFRYQTQAVQSVFEVLDAKQRETAIASGSPGEQANSVKFRPAGQPHPGIGYHDLSKDQRQHVETVMREILSPYRREDADEVMQIVKTNGGWDKLHLAFYKDSAMKDDQPWHFWRLEGPGFVWNYRVLPHVHCYVHIASQAT